MNRLLLLLTLCALASNSSSQIKITGQVLDTHNNTIELATVDLIGTNITTTTDDVGVFYLTLPTSNKKGDVIRLRVSKLGYKTTNKQVAVSGLTIPVRLNKLQKVKSRLSPKASTTASLPQLPKQVPTVNVTSNFQSGGITANEVNIGSVPRKFGIHESNQLLTSIPDKNEHISVTSVMGDPESFRFATEISDFLKKYGYKNVNGVSQAMYTRPVIGQFLDRDSTGVSILIGSKP